jgi:hypothetical protein
MVYATLLNGLLEGCYGRIVSTTQKWGSVRWGGMAKGHTTLFIKLLGT